MVNLRTRKSRLKLFLFVFALLITGITLWYTNQLANTIAKEEEKKVKVWADAIKEKAKLVRFTNRLFNKLSEDERKKVYNYSRATHLIVESDEKDGQVKEVIEELWHVNLGRHFGGGRSTDVGVHVAADQNRAQRRRLSAYSDVFAEFVVDGQLQPRLGCPLLC